MSLRNKSLTLSFILCLLFTLFLPSFFPSTRLYSLVPFLVIAFYQKSLVQCLWLGLGCGLFLDALSSNTHLGIHALAYCFTVFCLHPLRKIFFADSLSTLPIMTFLFSFLTTFSIALLLYSIEMQNVFSWTWLSTDLFLMPLTDSLYAYIFFVIPSMIFSKPQRRSKDYFFTR